jgi:hypothetical protein
MAFSLSLNSLSTRGMSAYDVVSGDKAFISTKWFEYLFVFVFFCSSIFHSRISDMFICLILFSGFFHCLTASSRPPPAGKHHVHGEISVCLNHTTSNDPVASNKISGSLLLSFFYPTASEPKTVRPYLGHTTARVFEDVWNYTAGTLLELLPRYNGKLHSSIHQSRSHCIQH